MSRSGQAKPLALVVEELQRELSTRARVYPRWIAEGKITQADADHRYLCIATALKEIQGLVSQRVGRQSGMFDKDFDKPFEPIPGL